MRSFLPIVGFQVLTAVTMKGGGGTVFRDAISEGGGPFFKISINFYWTTQCYMPEESVLSSKYLFFPLSSMLFNFEILLQISL
jgi:hypothetical protein